MFFFGLRIYEQDIILLNNPCERIGAVDSFSRVHVNRLACHFYHNELTYCCSDPKVVSQLTNPDCLDFFWAPLQTSNIFLLASL